MMKKIQKLTVAALLSTALCLTACLNADFQTITPVPMVINGVEVERAILPFSGVADRVTYDTFEELLKGISPYYGVDFSNLDELRERYEDGEWTKETYEMLVDLHHNYKPGVVVIGEFIEEAKMEFVYRYDPEFERDMISMGIAYNQLRVTRVLEGDIQVGDVITVWQAYAFDEEYKEFISFGELTPMHKGDRWIHFLKYDTTKSCYVNVGDSYGRFPLPDKETMRVMEKYIGEHKKIDKWVSDKKVDMTRSQAQIEQRKEEKKPFEERDIFLWSEAFFNLDKNGVIRFTNEQYNEWGAMWQTAFKMTDKIETSTLGVYNRDDFNFWVYAKILEHFKIDNRDNWVNPGRGHDAWLLALRG